MTAEIVKLIELLKEAGYLGIAQNIEDAASLAHTIRDKSVPQLRADS